MIVFLFPTHCSPSLFITLLYHCHMVFLYALYTGLPFLTTSIAAVIFILIYFFKIGINSIIRYGAIDALVYILTFGLYFLVTYTFIVCYILSRSNKNNLVRNDNYIIMNLDKNTYLGMKQICLLPHHLKKIHKGKLGVKITYQYKKHKTLWKENWWHEVYIH